MAITLQIHYTAWMDKNVTTEIGKKTLCRFSIQQCMYTRQMLSSACYTLNTRDKEWCQLLTLLFWRDHLPARWVDPRFFPDMLTSAFLCAIQILFTGLCLEPIYVFEQTNKQTNKQTKKQDTTKWLVTCTSEVSKLAYSLNHSTVANLDITTHVFLFYK